MAMMRSETFKKRIAEEIRKFSGSDNIIAGLVADDLIRLPVPLRDEMKKAALIKELRSIDQQFNDLYRRCQKAAKAIERLSVRQALMPRP